MSFHGDDADMGAIDESQNDLARQGCYVFSTSGADSDETDSRPKKRRKVSQSKDANEGRPSYPSLLGGHEPGFVAELRRDAFEQMWTVRQIEIDKIITELNNSFIEDIARFVRYAPQTRPESKLSTGLVVVGRDSGVQERLIKQWQSNERTKKPSEYLVQLDHEQAASITSALKSILKSVISSALGQEGYVDFLSKHKRMIPMHYDLELLQRFEETKQVEKVVISIIDIESFDIDLLSDLISMLASWTDRIPFILFIGISTTVELLEARLSKSAIRHLEPQVFDLSTHTHSAMYKIFMASQHFPDGGVWLGPAAANVLLEYSKEQETTPQRFGQAIKYATMSHFFSNHLSFLAALEQDLDEDTQALVCQAARNTPSFMEYVETALNTTHSKNVGMQGVRSLFDDNEQLMSTIREKVAEGQAKMQKHYDTVATLKAMIVCLRNVAAIRRQDLPGSDLKASPAVLDDIFEASVLALTGPEAVEIILEKLYFHHSLEALSADTFYNFICSTCFPGMPPFIDGKAHTKLRQHAKLLLAIDDPINLFLNRDPRQATSEQKEYQTIQADFIALFEDGLRASLIDPTTLLFHEVFIYNSKTPLAQAFAPSPRYAIERALDRPSDYLGCECCATEENGSSAQPPTAILWRLWCEAGSLVNVRDLWEAFRSTVVPQDQVFDGGDGDEDGDEQGEESSERRALALFYRGLAEMQMLGMLKQSRRKPGVECLAKIAWRGM